MCLAIRTFYVANQAMFAAESTSAPRTVPCEFSNKSKEIRVRNEVRHDLK